MVLPEAELSAWWFSRGVFMPGGGGEGEGVSVPWSEKVRQGSSGSCRKSFRPGRFLCETGSGRGRGVTGLREVL